MEIIEFYDHEVYSSIDKTIKEEINKLKEYISKDESELDNTKGFDKLDLKNSIKDYKKRIIDLSELNKAIYKFYFMKSEKYSLPEELINDLKDLWTRLDDKDAKLLGNVVNDNIVSINRHNSQLLTESIESILKILEKLNYTNREIMVYSYIDGYLKGSYRGDITYKKFIEDYSNKKIKELRSNYIFFYNSNPIEIKPDFSIEQMLDKLTKMINNKQLEINKNSKNVIENFDQIKELFYRQAKLEYALSGISNTISTLNQINNQKLDSIKSTLLQLKSKYKMELEKIRNNLSKYDFSNVKNQIEVQKEKEEKNNKRKNRIDAIEKLAYDIEKAKTENPNDYQHISDLKEKLRDSIMNSPLSENEIDEARTNGQEKYITERNVEKEEVNKAKAKIEYEKQLKKDVMIQMREYAIKELERSGAFEENYEYRNGDIHSVPMDKEKIIQGKIEELKRLAELTPEQRGLEDFKKHGLIPFNATIESLTPTQLNDIRIGYSDNSYGFITAYKSWKARESVKPLANNIFKEYLKYRSSLQEKNEFLSFSDYAKQMHNIDQMSESMVDQDLRDELKEIYKYNDMSLKEKNRLDSKIERKFTSTNKHQKENNLVEKTRNMELNSNQNTNINSFFYAASIRRN